MEECVHVLRKVFPSEKSTLSKALVGEEERLMLCQLGKV